MVPEIKCNGYFTKDGMICGESNLWTTAQGQKKI